MALQRQKFATQVEVTLLKEIRRIAQEEGRQIQAVVEEAFETLIEQRQRERPRQDGRSREAVGQSQGRRRQQGQGLGLQAERGLAPQIAASRIAARRRRARSRPLTPAL